MQTYNLIIDQHQRDTTQHGTPDFPLAVYTTVISKNLLGFVDWHWHNEIQFSLVTRGTVTFNIESNTETLKEGEAIFINSTALHCANNANGSDGAYICLDIHPLMLLHSHSSLIDSQYIAPFISNKNIPYCRLDISQSWSAEIIRRIHHINDIYGPLYNTPSNTSSPGAGKQSAKQQNVDYLDLYIDVIEMWHLMYDYYFSQKQDTSKTIMDDTILNIMKYICAHYEEKITLQDIASFTHTSAVSCSRKFKANMNCSIFEYIMNYRLSKSEELLLNTSLPITEIAVNCGFGTASYYIKHFRQACGVSPAVYRKQHS